MDVLHALSDKIQHAQHESVATLRPFCEKKEKIKELELKFCLLTDDIVGVADLEKQLSTWEARIAILEEFSTNFNKSLVSMTWSDSALRMEWGSARAAIARGETIMRVFADRVQGVFIASARAVY